MRRRRRLPRNEQKELEDQTRLLRAWNARHREQLEQALAGAHGALVAELMTVLDRLELGSAAALLACVERADWGEVSYDTRLTVLHQVNTAITRMRERHGLVPFDDGIPGQRDNVFRRIRSILVPLPASAGATPEPMPVASSTSIQKSGEPP
jgi:hypothetical protein